MDHDDDSTERHPDLGHDPEKWTPVFGKDHAHTISWIMMTIRLNVILI